MMLMTIKEAMCMFVCFLCVCMGVNKHIKVTLIWQHNKSRLARGWRGTD